MRYYHRTQIQHLSPVLLPTPCISLVSSTPHLQRIHWAHTQLRPVKDFDTYTAIVVQLLLFVAEKLRKKPCSCVAAVPRSAGATLYKCHPNGTGHTLVFCITPCLVTRETNPFASRQVKVAPDSPVWQNPGLTKVLITLVSQEGNVTNSIWISRSDGHQELFRQTKVGTTACVVLTPLLCNFLFCTVKMKKLKRGCTVDLNRFTYPKFQKPYTSQILPYQLGSPLTHGIFLPFIAVGILAFPNSNLCFSQLLTLDEKATRMYNTLHEKLKGNAEENC